MIWTSILSEWLWPYLRYFADKNSKLVIGSKNSGSRKYGIYAVRCEPYSSQPASAAPAEASAPTIDPQEQMREEQKDLLANLYGKLNPVDEKFDV